MMNISKILFLTLLLYFNKAMSMPKFDSIECFSEDTNSVISIDNWGNELKYDRLGCAYEGNCEQRVTQITNLNNEVVFKLYSGRSIIESLIIKSKIKEDQGIIQYFAILCDGNDLTCEELETENYKCLLRK